MEQTRYFTLVFTSVYYSAKDIKKNIIPASATISTLLSGIALAIFYLRKKTEKIKKDFLILLLGWLGVFFALSIPVSFQLRPRFFILVFPLPFIFLGLWFEFLEGKFKKYIAIGIILAITAAVLASNGYGTYLWFREQQKSQIKSTPIKRTLILKNKDGVTLGQLERVVDYIYQNRKPNATIYYYVKPEHVFPIKYLLRQKNDPLLNFSPLKINSDPNAQYFAIVPDHSGLDKIKNKIGDNFNVISNAKFGQLAVYEIEIPNRNASSDFRFNKDKGNTDRVFWKDVFGIEGNPNVQVEGGE